MLKLTEISTIRVDHVSFYLFTYFIYLFYISYILFIYLFIDLLIDWLTSRPLRHPSLFPFQ